MAKNSQRDRYRFDVLRDGPVIQDLGAGDDEVIVRARDAVVDQIRLSFVRADAGDGNPNEGTLPGQDGGLALRLQAKDAAGTLFGPISRFNDEGITFRSQTPGLKFDVRDVGATPVGLFDVAIIGTSGADQYEVRNQSQDYYIHGGDGDDRIKGGRGNDYLVGGFNNDRLKGKGGDDTLVGGPDTDWMWGGEGNDTAIYRVGLDGADWANLEGGDDIVRVIFPPGQVRLTLSTLQIGNGNPNDSGALTNEDGNLNVRLQGEDSAGNLVGPVSRFDDEGITFIGGTGITFDIRNLPDGAVRGSNYGIAHFGTSGDDVYDDSGSSVSTFHNGGMGNDILIGGNVHDHLVGLDGDDRLEGGGGDDLVVGLAGSDTFVFAANPGRDTILTYEPGTDRIDLSAYGIDGGDVQATAIGPNTLIQVDSNQDGAFDFEIFLGGSAPPQPADYIF